MTTEAENRAKAKGWPWIDEGVLRGDDLRRQFEHNREFLRAASEGLDLKPVHLRHGATVGVLLTGCVNYFINRTMELDRRAAEMAIEFPEIVAVYAGREPTNG